MLQGLFNYDNPVWRFIGKLGDLILLNILWIICSIPVFTIGASTTAVYYVTLKLARDVGGLLVFYQRTDGPWRYIKDGSHCCVRGNAFNLHVYPHLRIPTAGQVL